MLDLSISLHDLTDQAKAAKEATGSSSNGLVVPATSDDAQSKKRSMADMNGDGLTADAGDKKKKKKKRESEGAS